MTSKFAIITLLCAGSVWLAGCEQEGPAEQAGENVDKSMERAGEQMERAGERAQEATD